MTLPRYVYKVSFDTLGCIVRIQNEDTLSKAVALYNVMNHYNKKSRVIDYIEVPVSGSGFNLTPSHRIYILEIVSTKRLDSAKIEDITISLIKNFDPVEYRRKHSISNYQR